MDMTSPTMAQYLRGAHDEATQRRQGQDPHWSSREKAAAQTPTKSRRHQLGTATQVRLLHFECSAVEKAAEKSRVLQTSTPHDSMLVKIAGLGDTTARWLCALGGSLWLSIGQHHGTCERWWRGRQRLCKERRSTPVHVRRGRQGGRQRPGMRGHCAVGEGRGCRCCTASGRPRSRGRLCWREGRGDIRPLPCPCAMGMPYGSS